ncbi:hypothetical protein [Klebsiella michiganensis]|uniref:hypothetical protein n=1 Tax=Klebsiella michiganensis TaxID=1134687 RepID=UPI003DA02301
MTSKLTITDERIEKIAVWLATESHSLNLEMLTCLRELQERRKAEQDSEPVGEVIEVGDALLVEWHRNLEEGAKLYAAPQPAPVIPSELHPDTKKLVTEFGTAMAEKLYKAQLKYGYDADWKQDGWTSQCQAHFHQHIAKGDPRDVAAYCAFMWYHGWKTEAAQPAPVVMDDTKLRELFDSWFASDCSFDLSPEASEADNIAWRESYWYVWQRCRAAMLQLRGRRDDHQA